MTPVWTFTPDGPFWDAARVPEADANLLMAVEMLVNGLGNRDGAAVFLDRWAQLRCEPRSLGFDAPRTGVDLATVEIREDGMAVLSSYYGTFERVALDATEIVTIVETFAEIMAVQGEDDQPPT